MRSVDSRDSPKNDVTSGSMSGKLPRRDHNVPEISNTFDQVYSAFWLKCYMILVNDLIALYGGYAGIRTQDLLNNIVQLLFH